MCFRSRRINRRGAEGAERKMVDGLGQRCGSAGASLDWPFQRNCPVRSLEPHSTLCRIDQWVLSRQPLTL
jgi:hypothetical protein